MPMPKPKHLLEIGLNKRKFFLVLLSLSLTFVTSIWATVGIDEATWNDEPGILSVGVAGWFRDLPLTQYRILASVFASMIGLAIFWFVFIYIRTDRLDSAFSIKIDKTDLKLSSLKKPLGTASIFDRVKIDKNILMILKQNGNIVEYKLCLTSALVSQI